MIAEAHLHPTTQFGHYHWLLCVLFAVFTTWKASFGSFTDLRFCRHLLFCSKPRSDAAPGGGLGNPAGVRRIPVTPQTGSDSVEESSTLLTFGLYAAARFQRACASATYSTGKRKGNADCSFAALQRTEHGGSRVQPLARFALARPA